MSGNLFTLEEGTYQGEGSCYTAHAPKDGLPVEWRAKLSRLPRKIRLEGSYSLPVGARAHTFELEASYPGAPLGTASFEFASAHLEHVVGSHRASGDGVEFSGRDRKSGTTVTLVLEALRPGTLDGKGTLVHSDGAAWTFDFKSAIGPPGRNGSMLNDREISRKALDFQARAREYRMFDVPGYSEWAKRKLDEGESEAFIANLDATSMTCLPEELQDVTEQDFEDQLADLKWEIEKLNKGP